MPDQDAPQTPAPIPPAAALTPSPSQAPSASQPGTPQPGASLSPNVSEALANLGHLIPGFAGYKGVEDRRIADKQLRAVIGERLIGVQDRLDAIVEAASRAGNLDGLALIDQSKRRLGRLIDRMRFADYG